MTGLVSKLKWLVRICPPTDLSNFCVLDHSLLLRLHYFEDVVGFSK